MKIHEVRITARHLNACAAFYRDVLQMPVVEQADCVTVTIGSSQLILTRGDLDEGVPHLAFGISPHDFDLTRRWLGQRLELITVDDSPVIIGPDGWDSQSLYFLGPENILLEFIARQADSELGGSDDHIPQPVSISEVGIGVPDVGAAVHKLTTSLGLPQFPPQLPRFAPVGDHDGLLIVVDQERLWFPTFTHRAARGPLTARIDAPRHPWALNLAEATITAAA
jgi:catechol 2,3-dioxygenase-like lactoylglutathione lyase family enzyme